MKKLLLILLLLINSDALAETKCFIAKEGDKILQSDGDCDARYAPQCSFNIALSLMGYDAGILDDDTHPEWPLKEGYDFFINTCKGPHNPRTWMRDSCVWYSQVLTQKLGMEKFSEYVTKFDYGNKDVSGDKDKNNGLTNAWLSSSLTISPKEQTAFLQKFIDHKLPVSAKSFAMTKKIMFTQEMSGGWKLYGKTGSSSKHGWHVGWIEKNGRAIVFASLIADDKKQDIFPSFRARNEALIKLWYIINELEK